MAGTVSESPDHSLYLSSTLCLGHATPSRSTQEARTHVSLNPGISAKDFRALLPRLQHVRLRLSTMCDSLFGSEQELSALESSLHPQTAPALETVLINCMGKSVLNQARLCGSYQEDEYHLQYIWGRDAAPVLAACMQGFVACCP